jgi:hypothetical protein
MKFAIPLALVLGVFAPLAYAEEPRLPFNPFEKSKEGDWCILQGSRRSGDAAKKTYVTYWRVLKVEKDTVIVSKATQVGDSVVAEDRGVTFLGPIEESKKTFSSKEPATLESFFDLKDGTISDVKIEEEARDLGRGRKYACKKVSFVWTQKDERTEVTASLAPDLKAGGVAFFETRSKGTRAEHEASLKIRAIASGTDDDSDFGPLPDAYLNPQMVGNPEEKTRFPFNPFSNAKAGDWAAFVAEAGNGKEIEKAPYGYEISAVGTASVTIQHSVYDGGEVHCKETTVSIDVKMPPSALDFIQSLMGISKTGRVVREFKIEDEKHMVGGREFACKKITWRMPGFCARGGVTVWLSSAVKGTGLVELEIKLDNGTTMRSELVGYGTKGKAEWGETVEGLAAKLTKENPKKRSSEKGEGD